MLVGAALAAAMGASGCTCGRDDDTASTTGPEKMLAFETSPTVDVAAGLPDPLWALELGRLPPSAQHVVLVNPEKLRGAVASGALRERLAEVLEPLGGPLALALVEGLLEDVDGSRPIAVGAFALPNERELADARFGAVTDTTAIPAFVHTRVIVPGRDALGLLSALATASEGAGIETYALDPALTARLPPSTRVFAQSPADAAARPDLVVVAIPDHRELRLEILWGTYTNRPHYEDQLLRVAAPPREHPPPRSPALNDILIERPLLGIIERPEGAAQLAFATALIESARAVEESSSSHATATWARGLAVALVGYATLDPRDRIQAETALGIDLDQDLVVRSVTTLTPAGASVADAAVPSSGYVYDAIEGKVALWLRSGESMRASTDAALPPTWTRSLSEQELRGRWSWASGLSTESGIRHSRWPTLGTISRVLAPEGLDVSEMLPDAMTLAVGHGDPAPIAIALDYGPQVDVAAAQSALEGLPWPDGVPALTVHEVQGRKLLLVGIGGDADQLIDVAQPHRPGQLERVWIDRAKTDAKALLPETWASWFEMLGPAWAGWIDAVDRANYLQVRRGATLLGHATIGLEPGRKPAQIQLRAHAEKAPAPLAVVEDGQGWHCLRDIPVLAIDALDAVSAHHSTPAGRLASSLGYEDPDWAALGDLVHGDDERARNLLSGGAQALDTIWSTIDPLLQCAEQEPASEPTARRVRAHWLAALATWADALPDPERARAWGREGCTAGAQRACELLERMHARESVALVVRPWLSYALLGTPSLELAVAPRTMWLEGRPVAGIDDLERSLHHRLSARPLLGRDVAVHVDAAVSVQVLRAVVDVILAHGLVPQLVVRDPVGRLMALEITGPDPAWPVEPISLRAKPLVRPASATPALSHLPRNMTWAQLSERLLELGALPPSPSPGEAARHRAVGSASAVPALVLGQ